MSLKDLLQNARTNLGKPGAARALLGQIAIAYGYNMVSDAASALSDRLEAASRQHEIVMAAIEQERVNLKAIRGKVDAEAHGRITKAIVYDGDFDKAVRTRAAELGWHPPVEPVDVEPVDLADDDPADDSTVGMLAGDGSPKNPFRTVETVAGVLDESPRDGDDRD